MPQIAWAETAAANITGIFSLNPVTNNVIVSFQAIYADTSSGKRDIITGINIEIPNGSTLQQLHDTIVNGIKAKGAEYGYTNITVTLIPSFQVN